MLMSVSKLKQFKIKHLTIEAKNPQSVHVLG